MSSRLLSLLEERVLVMDGAMGTMIQTYGPTEATYRGSEFLDHPCPMLKGNNDLLSLTRPRMIADIHRAYLNAGADIITTNTFNANAISQADYRMQDLAPRMNREAAAVACGVCREYEAAHPGSVKFVAGSMGPTNKSASIASDAGDPAARTVDFLTLESAYRDQAQALLEGGVDILLIETVFDTLNAKAALSAVFGVLEDRGEPHFPVMLSASLTEGGRLLSGQSVEAFWASVSHFPLLSVGFNCSFGADKMAPYVEEISRLVPCYVSVYPNAGLPDHYGRYNQTPQEMADKIERFLRHGWVNFIGGCCGTSPEYIAAMASRVGSYRPRLRPKVPPLAAFSGCDVLHPSESASFMIVGERTNVAGSRKFARLIREEKFEEALEIALDMAKAGAHVLDVNMDDGMLCAPEAMRHFLLLLGSEPQLASLPVMVDTSQWPVVEAALQVLQGKSIVNSISLKEGEAEFLRRARYIRRMGAAVVVMAFDETGQATTYEHKVAIVRRAYGLLTEQAGFGPEDIVFDVNVLTIATGMEEHRRFAADFIQAVRTVKKEFPGVLLSGGVSNLSFAFRGNDALREAMHAVFLYHCIAAGMDMAIVKPGAQPVYDTIDTQLRTAIEDVIFDRDAGAVARLTDLAGKMGVAAGEAKAIKAEAWRELPAADRLSEALVLGVSKHLEEDLAALADVSALALVEGPLMQGMSRVGVLFGAGKLFLPQVVKSARVMKDAVAILQPRLTAENAASGGVKGPLGIFATVKGDVHDIGKNLTAVVMECNNYRILDLGVMVPAQNIVNACLEHKAQFLCLSGLITPSLEEMTRVAEAMDAAGLDIPIIVGGATTSKEYTALRIAPVYRGLVIHAADASQNVSILGYLFGPEGETYAAAVRAAQETLREQAARVKPEPVLSEEEARANRFRLSSSTAFVPPFRGLRDFSVSFKTLLPLISWEGFYHYWSSRHEAGAVREMLRRDATRMIQSLGACRVRAVVGFFPAAATPNDEIVLFADDARDKILLHLPQRRCLKVQKTGSPNYSLADFLAPVGESGDYLGLFCLTADTPEARTRLRALHDAGAIDEELLLQSVLDMLAEAGSAWLHRRILPTDTGRVCGIRPAFGYPMCPDHTQKRPVFDLLEAGPRLGLTLTESCMLQPVCSVCGMYFGRSEAHYFAM